MFKNVASQKIALFAFNITTGAAKTGDSANITGSVVKDWGARAALGTPGPAEIDATNCPGWYQFTLTQGETNADALLFTAISSTSSISIVGCQLFTFATDWAQIRNQGTAVNLSATQIQSVNNLAAGSDSINTIATSGSTLTTGSATSGTYANTATLDSVYWQIADATGTLDMYFEFSVGATGVPTTAVWTGGLTSAVDTLKVFAYNWGGVSWDQVGTLAGTTSLLISEQQYDFTTAHVGTGGNIGLVRLRFQNTGLTTANFYTDQVLCGYTSVLTTAGIATSVWQDTTAGDFTTALSVGKSVMNGVALGTGLTVAAVSGAVGSVTARVTANTDQINGNANAATNVSKANQAIMRGVCSGGSTTTAICSSITTPASLTDAGQMIGRTIIFDSDTTTTNVQGQASNITASTTGATPTLTFTAMTHAPANGDTFSVV